MDLQNQAQGKTFTADSKVVERRGAVPTFLVQPTARVKPFADTRIATVKEYQSPSFRSDSRANSSIQTRQIKLPGQLTASSLRDLRPAYDAHREVSGRTFGNERVFRGEGKSQKSLNRENPSLTIDQVRELLNKNK